MKVTGIYFPHAIALLILLLYNSEAHFHKHFNHARFHSSRTKFLELRHDSQEAETKKNETTENIPKPHTKLENQTGKCEFPKTAGLVAITPKAKNAGWAMSPNEQCSPGSYCPYACPSGQIMAQWNPNAKAYTYPQSMDGGLYCDRDGQVKKPFPEKPYCVSGTGGVGVRNKVGKGVAFCQTVLPGNEAMLIPTHVEDSIDLAVPGTSYWCNTAAHYYINPPGIGVEEACVWGDESKPVGNWSPYVAGANTDESGRTFVKVGWNPIYTGSSLAKSPPNFGVKISCDKEDCVGTPCLIDPIVNGVGGVQSATKATGAGGADFCVVTVPKGSKAHIEVYMSSKAQGDKGKEPSKLDISPAALSESSETEHNVEHKPVSSMSIPTTSDRKVEEPANTESQQTTSTFEVPQPSLTPISTFNESLNSTLVDSEDEERVKKGAVIHYSKDKPDHLFDETSKISPNDPTFETQQNHPSINSLTEINSKHPSAASAGTEHNAAFTSHSVSDSYKMSSIAPKVRSIFYLETTTLVCGLIFVHNFLY